MTVQELLAPRYKVIAKWPGMWIYDFEVGQVLHLKQTSADVWYFAAYALGDSLEMKKHSFDEMPYLFQPLEWWEERELCDMPQFLNVTESSILSEVAKGSVIKVLKHFTNRTGQESANVCQVYGDDYLSYRKTLPASEEEFNNYIKQINMQKETEINLTSAINYDAMADMERELEKLRKENEELKEELSNKPSPGTILVDFSYGHHGHMTINAGGSVAMKELAKKIKNFVTAHGPLPAISRLNDGVF